MNINPKDLGGQATSDAAQIEPLENLSVTEVRQNYCCICSSTSARLHFRLPDGSSFLLMFLPEKIILDWQTVVAEDKLQTFPPAWCASFWYWETLAAS